MKMVLATHNLNKAGEMLRILAGLDIEFIALPDFAGAPDVEEDGSTLEENAVKKANSAAMFTGLPALADDTGLEVDALGGAPGVFSARYAGPGCSYGENNKKLLSALAGLPSAKRSARFRCVMALVYPGGKLLTAQGQLEGFITLQVMGKGGFGYDPIFEVKGLGKTLAELAPEEKNIISHRAAALRAMLELLKSGQ
ncbi:MAG TPA: non-canonical purine NTP pyrophosphatase, RdgB/HAM1 family [Elusimicrobia bacterium]|nr:non-canonical purine NTP pyrophosphatase, RdgB/HAM1 family [Elusimicrobiota bacterium]